MLRKHVLTFLILSLVPVLVIAQPDNDLFDYSALNLNLLITNDFEVVPVSGNSYLSYVSAQLSWFPIDDYRQETDYISTEPRAKFDEESGFLFEWAHPSETSFSISQESILEAKDEFKRVNKKIVFPIQDLDPKYAVFLEPGKIIDIDQDIKSTASGIVGEEDDLYKAVFKLARWAEDNIEYNLSTMTVDASQKASWVLENRKGVCDEITSLFIAMCRSLGMPARFVTGISYSNIYLENNGWGPHGWAEVYFPGDGWVPFDITYKEYGWVDATHIKLKTSADTEGESMSYSSKGYNAQLVPGSIEFNVSVLSRGFKKNPVITVNARIAESQTGFGSYNLLTAEVENPHAYYVTARLSLTRVKGLEIKSSESQSVVLMPGEKTRIYWLIKVSPSLEQGFTYTFPMKIYSDNQLLAETSFEASEYSPVFSEGYITALMIADEPEEKPYSKNVLLTCSASQENLYLNQSVNISCTIDNKGEQELSRLRICLGEECTTTRVASGVIARYDYVRTFETLGVKIVVFSAENDLIQKSYYSVIKVQDKPLVEISNLSYPEIMSYDELSEVTVFIRKKSTNKPRNVKVRVEHQFIEQEWSIPSMEKDHYLVLKLRGENLVLNQNKFRLRVTYQDQKGETYAQEEEFIITLENPTFHQKLMIWLNIAEHKIREWLGI